MADYPYLRRAELYLSAIPEWRGGSSEAQSVQICRRRNAEYSQDQIRDPQRLHDDRGAFDNQNL